MKILITNLHSSHNAGDAALALAAVQQLQAAFPGSQLALSMNQPDSFTPPADTQELEVVGSFQHWAQSPIPQRVMRWHLGQLLWLVSLSLLHALVFRLRRGAHHRLFGLTPAQQRFLQAFFAADLVVSAPGNFLYSSGRFSPALLLNLFTLGFAHLLRKPLYLFPQSIGPFQYAWQAAQARRLLRPARLIMLREPVSLQALQSAGFVHPGLRLVPDLAFAFTPAPPEAARRWLESCGVDLVDARPRLGVTLINWGAQGAGFSGQAQYEAHIAQALRIFAEQTAAQIILFTQVSGATHAADDSAPARRVAASLADFDPPPLLIDQPAAPALLKAAYGWMDLFIGTRMHSNLFALTQGVPVLAIAYRYKTQGLMQSAGLADWLLTIDAVAAPDGAARLAALLSELWAQRRSVRAQIETRLADLTAQASQAGALVAADYASRQR